MAQKIGPIGRSILDHEESQWKVFEITVNFVWVCICEIHTSYTWTKEMHNTPELQQKLKIIHPRRASPSTEKSP